MENVLLLLLLVLCYLATLDWSKLGRRNHLNEDEPGADEATVYSSHRRS